MFSVQSAVSHSTYSTAEMQQYVISAVIVSRVADGFRVYVGVSVRPCVPLGQAGRNVQVFASLVVDDVVRLCLHLHSLQLRLLHDLYLVVEDVVFDKRKDMKWLKGWWYGGSGWGEVAVWRSNGGWTG